MNDNYEHHTPENEQPRSGADYFIEYCIGAAPTRRLARTIRRLYEEEGAAFAAYLSLDDVSPTSDTLAEDYGNAFVGTYFDEDTLVENELASLGWTDAIDAVIRSQGIPEGIIIWDRGAFLEHLRRHLYDIVDLDGYLHVFAK